MRSLLFKPFSGVHKNTIVVQYTVAFSFSQPIKEELKDERSWFELGHAVGVAVMDDDDEETMSQHDEVDKEMENLYTTTLDKHRRILKGTIYRLMVDQVDILCQIF